jgi:hypothetical protein
MLSPTAPTSRVPQDDAWRSPADVGVLLALALFGLAVGWHFVTPYHSWGDDWAGYVLQARAIDAGAIDDEIARNEDLLRSSDRRPGPSAYPWGFPALLWITGGASDLSLALLKIIGVISLALTCAATFALGRFFMSRVSALLAVAGSALQPVLLLSVDEIHSDLPFTAISTLALVVTVMQWQHGLTHRKLRMDLAAVIIGLTLLGYAIRSNGALIPVVYGLSVLLLVSDGAIARARLMRYLAAIATCVLAAVTAYWALVPDGSLYALSYVTASPALIVSQMQSVASESTRFSPLAFMPYPLQLLALGGGLFLVGIAVRVHGRIAWIVLGCCALHLLLLSMIRFPLTVRYVYPVVPPAAVLIVAGAVHLLRRSSLVVRSGAYARTVAAATLLASLTAIQLWAAGHESSPLVLSEREQGPFSVSAGRAFRAAAAATPAGRRIAFFKPRAYRLMTGREAIIVTDPARAAIVPCHLLYLPPTDDVVRVQVPESSLIQGGFVERYRNEHFALFCIRTG